VTTHDQGTDPCAIVTATVDGLPAEAVRDALTAAGINTTVTVPTDDPLDTEERGLPALLRLSPHYYNTEAELDRAVEVIAGL
jgi:selenocysteine lyase/cysteine desulfurase